MTTNDQTLIKALQILIDRIKELETIVDGLNATIEIITRNGEMK